MKFSKKERQILDAAANVAVPKVFADDTKRKKLATHLQKIARKALLLEKFYIERQKELAELVRLNRKCSRDNPKAALEAMRYLTAMKT